MKAHYLGHVVFYVRDLERSLAFYRDLLGFKLTDRFIGGLSFWACNANHHSLAFGVARDGQVAFNHAAFEMKDWEEWARAIFFAGERGIKRSVKITSKPGPAGGHGMALQARQAQR